MMANLKASLIHLFKKACFQDKTFDLWSIAFNFFCIICESNIFNFCAFFDSNFGSFYFEFLSKLNTVSGSKSISECIVNENFL